jgi:hypothetical protein
MVPLSRQNYRRFAGNPGMPDRQWRNSAILRAIRRPIRIGGVCAALAVRRVADKSLLREEHVSLSKDFDSLAVS